jgi:ferritin-like protein
MAASTELHEAADSLSTKTKNFHRAIVSLQEELEAVDWYRQRAEACEDDELREILLHNMREELEHAAMLLEWMRRNEPDVDEKLRTYLFTELPVTEIEEEEGSADADKAGPPGSKMTVGSMKGGA